MPKMFNNLPKEIRLINNFKSKVLPFLKKNTFYAFTQNFSTTIFYTFFVPIIHYYTNMIWLCNAHTHVCVATMIELHLRKCVLYL